MPACDFQATKTKGGREMVRRFRPSPALVIAVIALFVSLGGFSYAAADRIGTSQIANGAVTAKKLHRNAVTSKKLHRNAVTSKRLHRNAVTTKKLHDGAITADKLADRSVGFTKTDGTIMSAFAAGVALAGVNVAPTGVVQRFFNRYGGTPSVSHPSAGLYQIVFPGLLGKVGSTRAITLATLVSNVGEIRATSSSGNALVETANSKGKPANRGFNLVVVIRSP
jgi:hypothetical protein